MPCPSRTNLLIAFALVVSTIALTTIACRPQSLSTAGPWRSLEPWPSVDPTDLVAVFRSGVGYTGESFSLKADGSFDYTYWSCTFARQCTGKYELESGTILLRADGRYPSVATKKRRSRLKPVEWRTRRLLPVTWDDRLYLIDEKRIVSFCNQVNESHEPCGSRGGAFLLRSGDSDRPVTGLPSLSAEYAEYILNTPFETVVVERADYVVHLDKGHEDGLRVGMRLVTPRPSGESHSTTMEVVTVDANTAVAEIRWGRWLNPGEKAYIRNWKLNERPWPEYP